MSIDLAVIGGDGIGPEVVAEGLKVLRRGRSRASRRRDYDLGAAALPPHRRDAAGLRARASCAGTTRSCSAPSATRPCRRGVLERGLLLRLRFALDHHVNLRPVRLFPGVTTPLRRRARSTWSSSARAPRARTSATAARCATGTPHEVATEVSINTAYGVERVVRDAFGRAQARRKHLTLVHKTNVLVHAGGLWKRVGRRGARPSSPTSTVDYQHVDAASMFFVTDPRRFDVVVTDNLFGDILTDIGAAIGGGIGLAASGNLDVSRHQPVSMFEPVHGCAPDIAGQGKADPTATVLSRRDAARPPRPRRRGRAGRGGRRRRTSPTRGAGRAHTPRSATPWWPLWLTWCRWQRGEVRVLGHEIRGEGPR